jgi:hypothetical protein
LIQKKLIVWLIFAGMVLVETCFAQENTPISLPIDSTPLALQSHLSYRVDHPQALGPVYNLRHIDDWQPFESAPKGFSKGETVWLRADLNVDSAPSRPAIGHREPPDPTS